MNTKQFLIIALSFFGFALTIHAGLFRAAVEAPVKVTEGATRTTANVATLGASRRYNTYGSRRRSQDWQREQLEQVETEPPMNLVQGNL